MKETYFQQLFEKCINIKSHEIEKEVLKEVHLFIYFYPLKRYKVDEDLAADFYLEIIHKINQIILDYNPEYNISFIKYLTVKIKRRFLNFLDKKNRINELQRINEFAEYRDEIYSESVFEAQSLYLQQSRNQTITTIEKILSGMDKIDEIITRLYFGFPVKNSHLKMIYCLHKNPAIFSLYRQYKNKWNTYFQANETRRNRILERLQVLQNNIDKTHLFADIYKKERLVNNLYATKNVISLKNIADLLNTNVTYIFRKLAKTKTVIEEQLKDPCNQQELTAKNFHHKKEQA